MFGLMRKLQETQPDDVHLDRAVYIEIHFYIMYVEDVE